MGRVRLSHALSLVEFPRFLALVFGVVVAAVTNFVYLQTPSGRDFWDGEPRRG